MAACLPKGCSSIGRAADSKSAGFGFESRRPCFFPSILNTGEPKVGAPASLFRNVVVRCHSMGRIDTNSKSERDDETTRESESSAPKSATSDREEVDATVDDNADADGDKQIVRVGEDVDKGVAPTQLGATRYVMAGFFMSGIAVAYVIGRIVASVWNKLASTQSIVDRVGWLTSFGEEGRDTWGTLVGGLIAVGILIYVYRRDDIRVWVNEAAMELAKVTWPDKKEVTNGTVVVVVASIIATIYLALLDRFWGFVTDLVYRA